jgi:arginine dihydrolase
MSSLAWGRRYLLCPPDHFNVVYEINPYMHKQVHPDLDAARTQFDNLVSALEAAGASVEFLDPVPGLPDLVFTANAGIVNGATFITSRFRHPERQGETPIDNAWFAANGYELLELAGEEPFEGAGDALPFGLCEGDSSHTAFVAGYRTRSSVLTHGALSEATGVPVRSLELVDERYYHVDLVFCPLDSRHALVAPQGLDRFGTKVVEQLVPEPIWLEDDEAATFTANSVVVNDVVVMPACTPRLGRILEGIGLEVHVSAVGEFLKAGGGCRCLTLALDVVLPGASGSRLA